MSFPTFIYFRYNKLIYAHEPAAVSINIFLTLLFSFILGFYFLTQIFFSPKQFYNYFLEFHTYLLYLHHLCPALFPTFSCLSSKLWPTFCNYHFCIHTHTSTFTIAHIYICLGLTTGDWITRWGSFLMKMDSSSHSNHWLPITLHLVVGSHRIFDTHIGLSTSIVFRFIWLGNHIVEI